MMRITAGDGLTPPARFVFLGIVLSAATAVLLFWRIGDYPLTDGDAAYYARIARTIVETGEPFVLRFDPQSPVSDVDKPPLVMWAMAAMFFVFGATDLVARIWNAVASLAVLGVTALLAARVACWRVAAFAVIILLTTVLFFYQAREPLLDIPLTMCVTAALACVADRRLSLSFARLCAAACFVGLGVMTKGPVALVLIALPATVLLFLALPIAWSSAWRLAGRAAAALIIIAAVAVPWYAWIYVTQGPAFFDIYAGAMSWRRYLNPVHLPGVPVIVYGVFALAALFPWSGLAIPVIRAVWRERHANPAHFALGTYVVCGVLFFGLSPGVIFGKYLLPVLPASAVLIAWYLDRQRDDDRSVTSWTTVGIGAALVPAAAGLKMANPAGAGTELGLVLALLGATAIAGGLAWRRVPFVRGFAILAGGSATAYLVLLAVALPPVTALYPDRALAGLINREDGPHAQVAVYRPDAAECMFVFYLQAPRLQRLRDERDAARFAAQPRRVWILEREAAPLPEGVRRELTRVAGDTRVGLFVSREDRPHDSRRSSMPSDPTGPAAGSRHP